MKLARLFKAIISKVEVGDATTMDVVGLGEIMSTSVSDVSTFNCPHAFGGFHCGVTPVGTPVLITGSASTQAYTIQRLGTDPAFPVPNATFYAQGTLLMLTGEAAGLELNVNRVGDGGTDPVYSLKLLSVLTTELQRGDVGMLFNGCTKTLGRCNGYDNLDRGRHVPYLRGAKTFAAAGDLPDE